MKHKKQPFPKAIIIKKRRGGLAIGILREHVASYFDENKKKREEMDRLWKSAKPKLDKEKFGYPMIFGTGGNNLVGSEYFKKMWFDEQVEIVAEKMVGIVEQYAQWEKDNPPLNYDDPLTFEKMKEIIEKLSKQ